MPLVMRVPHATPVPRGKRSSADDPCLPRGEHSEVGAGLFQDLLSPGSRADDEDETAHLGGGGIHSSSVFD